MVVASIFTSHAADSESLLASQVHADLLALFSVQHTWGPILRAAEHGGIHALQCHSFPALAVAHTAHTHLLSLPAVRRLSRYQLQNL